MWQSHDLMSFRQRYVCHCILFTFIAVPLRRALLSRLTYIAGGSSCIPHKLWNVWLVEGSAE